MNDTSRIFLSYRRQDSPGFAGRIADHVNLRFGSGSVFRDVETIEGGVDFVDAINQAVGACGAFILVIGPRWLNAQNSRGGRRLEDPQDFVRMEVASALRRNIRVIPVLVEGAEMPSTGDLPADLQAIARRQAIEVTDARFEADIEELIRSLESVLGRPSRVISSHQAFGGPPPRSQPAPSPEPARAPSLPATAVPSHLVWSIASTACLCLPFGIVALIQSNKTTAALAMGDMAAAQAASAQAKKWNMIATGLGAVVWICGLIASALQNANH